MEHHLREMRERFESGFVNAPLGMAVVDMDGAWRQVNAALCRITGYHLKNLPFDSIKIDGELIRGLVSNPIDQLVVQAIVTIAQGLGKKTVAEFVGDEESTSVLRTIGVDYAQGYFIGEPRLITESLRISPTG